MPLRWAGYGPTTSDLADGGLGVLPTVNVATVVVAFVAGIAGILAFETRSSSAVGVAISITTIPAAAFAGAAAAVTDWAGAVGALSVLAVNILMLLTAGTITLLIQRRRRRPTDRTIYLARAGLPTSWSRHRAPRAATAHSGGANQYRTLTS